MNGVVRPSSGQSSRRVQPNSARTPRQPDRPSSGNSHGRRPYPGVATPLSGSSGVVSPARSGLTSGATSGDVTPGSQGHAAVGQGPRASSPFGGSSDLDRGETPLDNLSEASVQIPKVGSPQRVFTPRSQGSPLASLHNEPGGNGSSGAGSPGSLRSVRISSKGSEKEGAEGPLSARMAGEAARRRVTFEAIAPQGSAQAAAKFARQRVRANVGTTLRRSDGLACEKMWVQPSCLDRPYSPSEYATECSRLTAFKGHRRIVPEYADSLSRTPTPVLQLGEAWDEVDEPPKNEEDEEKGKKEAVALVEEGRSSTPSTAVGDPAALPQYVKSLWGAFNPTEEMEKDKHGTLVQALSGSTGVDEDAALRIELRKIRTGEDVIAFFATHGDQTHVKVIYCKRAEMGSCDFRPYDLQVVSEKERGQEYFMISSKGVVHVTPGKLSDHTTLSAWMHQAMIFSVLTAMPLFRNYLIGKSFSSWSSSARYQAYSALRFRLSRHLFLAKPTFASAQVKIHSLLYQISATRLLHLPADSTGRALELAPFVAHQRELCAASDFDQKADAAREVVDKAIELNFSARQIDPCNQQSKGKRFKGRSVAADRIDAQTRKHWKRMCELNVSMLGNFVRVVDVMAQSRLVGLVISQTQRLLERLEKSPKTFAVTVNFSEESESMEFTPGQSRYAESLGEVLDQAVDLVGAIAPLTTSRKYDEHFRNQYVYPAKASDVIRNSGIFHTMRQCIMDRVRFDFDNAQTFADGYFEPYRKIYNYGKICDEKAFEARILTHTELSGEMALIRKFEDEVEKLKAVHTCGFLLVEARTLRSTLTPVVDAGLVMMKAKLRSLARDKCKETFERYDHTNRELSARPVRLEPFAEYVRAYREIQQELPQLDECRNTVEEMYLMMRNYQIRVEMNEEVMKESLHQKVVLLELTTLHESANFVAELIIPRSEEVAGRITALEADAAALKKEVMTGIPADPAQIEAPSQVIDKLEQVEDQVNVLNDNAAWLNNCLSLFQQPESQMPKLTNAGEALEVQLQLWDLITQWHATTTAWLHSHPQALDVGQMRGRMEAFTRALLYVGKAWSLQGSVVVAEVHVQFRDWESMLPALAHLSNPSLTQAHWAVVMHMLDLSMQPDELTLIVLTGVDFAHADKLQELAMISAAASAEAGTDAVVKCITQDWGQRELVTTQVAPDGELWIIGDQTDVLDRLDSDTTSLQLVISAKDVNDVTRDLARDWWKKLQRIQEVLHLWLSVQQRYVALAFQVQAEVQDLDGHTHEARGGSIMDELLEHFRPIEHEWNHLLTRARMHYKTVISVTQQLQPQIRKIERELEPVEHHQRSLLSFHRTCCPRLYLCPDVELLRALANASHKGPSQAAKNLVPMLFNGATRMELEAPLADSPPEVPPTHLPPSRAAMVSAEGEQLGVQLAPERENLRLDSWLQEFDNDCQAVLQAQVRDAIKLTSSAPPMDVLQAWLALPTGNREGQVALPAQAMLVALAVQWAQTVEMSFASKMLDDPQSSKGLEGVLTKHASHIQGLVSLVNSSRNSVRQPYYSSGTILIQHAYSSGTQCAISAALLQALHSRSVLEALVQRQQDGALSSDSLEWQKRLRVSCQEEESVPTVRLLDWSLDYGCEYVGSAGRIVVTPETDRAFLALATSMHAHSGSVITGPSGCGKVETVRELARFAAVPVVEIAGQSVSDPLAMLQILRGIVSLGAWSLFHTGSNESSSFHDLDAFATPVRVILEAQRAAQKEVELGGEVISIEGKRQAAFFFLHHSASLGQSPAGMNRWPIALLSFSRPLAMVKPQTTAVTEALLLVAGFGGGSGIHEVTDLARATSFFLDYLSLPRTDAGLASLPAAPILQRAVQRASEMLRMGIGPKGALAKAMAEMAGITTGGLGEDEWSWGSDRQLWEDMFGEWVQDMVEDDRQVSANGLGEATYLTSTDCDVRERGTSAAKARVALAREVDIWFSNYGVTKAEHYSSPNRTQDSERTSPLGFWALEVHRHALARQPIVLTGAACAGKSTLLQVLSSATKTLAESAANDPQNEGGLVPQVLSLTRLYPNALPMGVDTENAGTLARLLQSYTQPKAGQLTSKGKEIRLLVLDAELDTHAPWVEELCLMDPRQHHLFPQNLTLALETRSLAGASPALCACLAICPLGGLVQPSHLVEAFVQRISARGLPGESSCSAVFAWLWRFLEVDILSLLNRLCHTTLTPEWAAAADLERVARMLRLLEGMLIEENGVRTGMVSSDNERELVEVWTIYAAAWGLGGSLPEADRSELGQALIETFNEEDGLSFGLTKLKALLSNPLNLWRFQIVVEDGKVFCVPLSSLLPSVTPPLQGAEVGFVPTQDSEAARHLCVQLGLSGQGFFLCGKAGSGKSSTVRSILQSASTLSWQTQLYTCRMGATGVHFSQFLRRRLDRQSSQLLGPTTGSRCCVVVDDVHLGSGSVLEMLRQAVDQSGFHDGRSGAFNLLQHVQLGCVGSSQLACDAHGASLSGVAPHRRWLRHFQQVRIQEPDMDSLAQICCSMVTSSPDLHPEIHMAIGNVVQHLFQLTENLEAYFPLQPSRPLAGVGLTQISRWCTGIVRGKPSSEEALLRLARHEASREFGDRFGTEAEREGFQDFLNDSGLLTTDTHEPLFAALVRIHGATSAPTSEAADGSTLEVPIAPVRSTVEYRDLGTPKQTRKILQHELGQILQELKQPFVLLEVVMSAALSVARGLSLQVPAGEAGGALLLGPPGSGKCSCAILGSHLAHARVVRSVATDTRGLQEELQKAVALAKESTESSGVESLPHVGMKPLVTLGPISEVQLRSDKEGESSFLASLDGIIRGAGIPAAQGEIDGEESGVIASFIQQESHPPSQLSVLLCLSPELSPERFRKRLRCFPSIASRLSAVWLRPWNQEAHLEVAQHVLLQEASQCEAIESSVLRSLAKAASSFPTSVMEYANSGGEPSGSCNHSLYMASLKLARDTLASKATALRQETRDLSAALQLLRMFEGTGRNGSKHRDILNDEALVKRQPEIQQQQAKLQAQIRHERLVVEKSTKHLQPLAAEHESVQANLDAEMAPQLSALEDVRNQLEAMSEAQVHELQILDYPTPQLSFTMMPLLVAFGLGEEWHEVTKFLNEDKPVQRLTGLTERDLDKKQLDRMEDQITDLTYGCESIRNGPGGEFAFVCASLFRALLNAGRAWEHLFPQHSLLEERTKKLESVQAEVDAAKKTLQGTEALMQALEVELVECQTAAARISREEVDEESGEQTSTPKIRRAVFEEAKVWRDRSQIIIARLREELPGNILLGAFLAHYGGPLQEFGREQLLYDWRTVVERVQVPCDPNLSMVDLFKALEIESSPGESAGSMDACLDPCSAWMCRLSRVRPLLIDPMDIGRPWVLNHLERTCRNSSTIINSLQHGDSLVEMVTAAATKNAPVVIDLLDGEVPPALEGAFSSQPSMSAALPEDVRIFLVSESPPDNYLGAGATHQGTAVVNFAGGLSPASLRAHLLEVILLTEEPGLHGRLLESKAVQASAVASMQRAESSLLTLVARHAERTADVVMPAEFSDAAGTQQGTVEDAQTAALLREIYQLQIKIKDSISKQQGARAEVENAEKLAARWEPVVRKAAALYRALMDSTSWHSAYRCNWRRFTQWLRHALNEHNDKEEVKPDRQMSSMSTQSMRAANMPIDEEFREEARIASFMQNAALRFYSAMMHGFFPRHRLALAFRIAIRLSEDDGSLPEGEVDKLLSAIANPSQKPAWEAPHWLQDPAAWQRLCELATERPPIKAVLETLCSDGDYGEPPAQWAWVIGATSGRGPSDSAADDFVRVPRAELPAIQRLAPEARGLTLMDEFLVTCALAPRLTMPALRHFVCAELGDLAEDLPPGAALCQGLASADAVRTASNGAVVLMTEEEPGVELRCELLHWLRQAAAEKNATLSTFSALRSDCADLVATDLELSSQFSPRWVFVPDVCSRSASLRQLSSIARQISEGIGSSQGALLLLGLQSSSVEPCPLPAGVLEAIARLVVAEPVGLRARLLDHVKRELGQEKHALGSTHQLSAIRASILWLFTSFAYRANPSIHVGGGCGLAMPYAWSAADLQCALRVLEVHGVHQAEDTSTMELAELAVELGFGVHVNDCYGRAVLTALTSDMAGPRGLLEVWSRMVHPDDAKRLPATAGLEELHTFLDSAMPEYDAMAHPSYLALACGLSAGRCSLQDEGSDGCLDEAWALLGMLQPASEPLPSPDFAEREATVLAQIRALEDELQALSESAGRCVLAAGPEVGEQQPSAKGGSTALDVADVSQPSRTLSGGSLRPEISRLPEVLQRELRHLLTTFAISLDSLAATAAVLEGVAQDTKATDLIYNALLKKEVPASWDLPGTLEHRGGDSLAAWLESMRDRIHIFCGWFLDGPPHSFWLGGFSCPQIFLTALLQQHAKTHDVDLDRLHIATDATPLASPADPSRPEDSLSWGQVHHHRPTHGAYVHGLALSRARWAPNVVGPTSALDFGFPGRDEGPWLPILHLLPVLQEELDRRLATTRSYSCPVYRRAHKQGGLPGAMPLLSLDLASAQDPHLWALRGVALFFEPPR